MLGAARPNPLSSGSWPARQKTTSKPKPDCNGNDAVHSNLVRSCTLTPGPGEVNRIPPWGTDGDVAVAVIAGVAVAIDVGISVDVDVGRAVNVAAIRVDACSTSASRVAV